MPNRPVFHEDLGEYFRSLREQRGWSIRKAEDEAADLGLTDINRDKLHRLETGQIRSPQPPLLKDVARLYGLMYEAVSARVSAAVLGTDNVEVKAPSTSKGAPHADPAADPTRLLAEVTEHHAQVLDGLHEIAQQLLKLADTRPPWLTGKQAPPFRKRRGRKAG